MAEQAGREVLQGRHISGARVPFLLLRPDAGASPETEDFRVPAGTEMTPELLQRLIDEFEQAHKPRYEYLDAAYRGHYAIFDRACAGSPTTSPTTAWRRTSLHHHADLRGLLHRRAMTLSVRNARGCRFAEKRRGGVHRRVHGEKPSGGCGRRAFEDGLEIRSCLRDALPRRGRHAALNRGSAADRLHGVRRLRAEAPAVLRALVLRRRRGHQGQLVGCRAGGRFRPHKRWLRLRRA